ncbi:MAG TPA: mercury transporter, partial [Flavobacteriales bacterium]|nr:mercury transporter [Flavobacteriales bacterium]
PIYLDHCPMYNGGADWLSREKAIKNPYYGSSMLTCGSVKETIGK